MVNPFLPPFGLAFLPSFSALFFPLPYISFPILPYIWLVFPAMCSMLSLGVRGIPPDVQAEALRLEVQRLRSRLLQLWQDSAVGLPQNRIIRNAYIEDFGYNSFGFGHVIGFIMISGRNSIFIFDTEIPNYPLAYVKSSTDQELIAEFRSSEVDLDRASTCLPLRGSTIVLGVSLPDDHRETSTPPPPPYHYLLLHCSRKEKDRFGNEMYEHRWIQWNEFLTRFCKLYAKYHRSGTFDSSTSTSSTSSSLSSSWSSSSSSSFSRLSLIHI